ncbi:MAG: T9SS type A sorting domain-containing protein [Ignavibacteriaceae bacterium]|nr:T9SS type A sorting domain-containing protein [Ignavibacteriaceae bacterium]
MFAISFAHSNFAQDITVLPYLTDKVSVSIIDITTAWNNTGINISVGDTVLIFVNGIAATDGALHTKTITWIGPEGMGGWIAGSGLPLPEAASHCVIGKIGDSGDPFYVGRNGSFVANVSGQLFLGLNDNIFWDNYGYYVAFITSTGTVTDVNHEQNHGNLNDYNLSQNFPNPFNPSTSIQYNVPGSANVQLTIYDINGQKVKELINEFRNSGNYTVTWDAKDNFGNKVSSGTYFYQVQVGNFIQTKKMILLK